MWIGWNPNTGIMTHLLKICYSNCSSTAKSIEKEHLLTVQEDVMRKRLSGINFKFRFGLVYAGGDPDAVHIVDIF